MHRLRLIALTLIAALVLTACGVGSTTSSPTAAPATAVQTTKTARPTPKPKATEESEAEPTEEPEAEPTEEPSEDDTGDIKTLPVDMSDLQTYTYDTNIFSIDIPASWSSEDKSSPGEILVRFSDKSNNGVVLVNILENSEQQSEDDLTTLLTNYLESTYSKQKNFSQEDPKRQDDGSILVVWGYDVKYGSKGTVRLLGNSFIQQNDNLISVLTLAVPKEQFTKLKPKINDVLNSYKPDTSVSVGGESNTGGSLKKVVIGDLETYNHDSGVFSIDAPQSWTVADTSESGKVMVSWTDPSENGIIFVALKEETSKLSEDELTDRLKEFLTNAFGKQQDFSMDDPKPQPDGSVLIVWTYTAKVSGIEAEMLGNSFVEQREDKLSILTTVVPHEQFDSLKPDTNKIINSYSIDETASIP